MKSRFSNALIGGIVVLAGLLALSYRAQSRFEQRARDAERFAQDQRHVNKALADENESLFRRIGKRDTLIVRERAAIVAVDRANPPPDSCAPNLAARDRVIESLDAQILDLGTALANARTMHANERAASDSLRAALKARPGALLNLGFLEIGRPKLGAFAGLCSNGGACYGGGLVIPIRIGGH